MSQFGPWSLLSCTCRLLILSLLRLPLSIRSNGRVDEACIATEARHMTNSLLPSLVSHQPASVSHVVAQNTDELTCDGLPYLMPALSSVERSRIVQRELSVLDFSVCGVLVCLGLAKTPFTGLHRA